MAAMTVSNEKQLKQCQACQRWEGSMLLCEFVSWAAGGNCAAFTPIELGRKPAVVAAVSDGSTASYYELPAGAAQLQDLISHRNMNAQMGEIFRATYRYGLASHSDQLRDAKKIKFYIEAEIARLEKLGGA